MHEHAPGVTPKGRWKRVLLKISGEALMGTGAYGIDNDACRRIAEDVVEAIQAGYEVCLVIGGGNIFRGLQASARGMDRASADYMGMLATVMNAIAMGSTIDSLGFEARVLSAIPMVSVCEPFIRDRAIKHMERGRVVIFAAGTGNPFFTTDTAAALRAAEMGCSALLKGTQVDGVYDSDPRKNPNAVRYERLTHLETLAKELKVMDATAVSLMKETNIPIVVFSIHERGNLTRVLNGEGVCTVIEG